MKDGFIIHNEYKKHIAKLTPEQKGMLLDALIAHDDGEDLPEMDDMTEMLFGVMCDRMDRDTEAYEERVEKNRKSGRLGGRPSKNQMVSEKTEWFSEKPKKPNPIPIPDPIPIPKPIPKPENKETKENGLTTMREKFTPPTVPEVEDYCFTSGHKVDAYAFVDFYSSKGWMVGRAKMRDWRAAVRNWERNEKARSGTTRSSVAEQFARIAMEG